jgi:tight adherence protein B
MIASFLAALTVLTVAAAVDRTRLQFVQSRSRRLLEPDRATSRRGSYLSLRVFGVPHGVRRAMIDAGCEGAADHLWRSWLASVPGAFLAGLAFLPLALVPLVVSAAAVGPYGALRSQRGRRARLIDRGLPDALDAVARSLRSGSSLRQAIGEASDRSDEPLGADLRSIISRVDRGMPLIESIGRWVEARRPSPPVRLSASALTMAADLGGSRARAVDRVSRSLRERRGVERELQALSSQARLSALVIVLAPAAFGLAGLAVNGETAAFLLSSPPGWVCLAGGASLDALCALWMTRVVRSVAT